VKTVRTRVNSARLGQQYHRCTMRSQNAETVAVKNVKSMEKLLRISNPSIGVSRLLVKWT